MKSLAVIETRGFVTAIQAVDAACKAAEVSCIGYRKVGAGWVSIFLEGEISAIHTAIGHGVAVVGHDRQVHTLVIARPEPGVVAASGNLTGYPPHVASRAEDKTDAAPMVATDAVAPTAEKTDASGPTTPPVLQSAAHQSQDKSALKRRRKG